MYINLSSIVLSLKIPELKCRQQKDKKRKDIDLMLTANENLEKKTSLILEKFRKKGVTRIFLNKLHVPNK